MKISVLRKICILQKTEHWVKQNIQVACTQWGFKVKIKLKLTFSRDFIFKILTNILPIPLTGYQGIYFM